MKIGLLGFLCYLIISLIKKSDMCSHFNAILPNFYQGGIMTIILGPSSKVEEEEGLEIRIFVIKNKYRWISMNFDLYEN